MLAWSNGIKLGPQIPKLVVQFLVCTKLKKKEKKRGQKGKTGENM